MRSRRRRPTRRCRRVCMVPRRRRKMSHTCTSSFRPRLRARTTPMPPPPARTSDRSADSRSPPPNSSERHRQRQRRTNTTQGQACTLTLKPDDECSLSLYPPPFHLRGLPHPLFASSVAAGGIYSSLTTPPTYHTTPEPPLELSFLSLPSLSTTVYFAYTRHPALLPLGDRTSALRFWLVGASQFTRNQIEK